MRQEQLAALSYLDRKGRSAPLSNVRQEVETAFSRLEDMLSSLEGVRTDQRPSTGQWSLIEIVDHLVESNRPAAGQLRAALKGIDPGAAIPAGLQSRDPKAKGWPKLLSELKATHASLLGELAVAEDSPAAREIPFVMVVKVTNPDGSTDILEWADRLHWKEFAIAAKVHTLEHLAQVKRVVTMLRPQSGNG